MKIENKKRSSLERVRKAKICVKRYRSYNKRVLLLADKDSSFSLILRIQKLSVCIVY